MSSAHGLGIADVVAPILIGVLFIAAVSLFKEPNRRNFMAIMIAGAGAAYLNGGLGIWEFLFTAVVTVCAYRGLRSYQWIGVGWVLHTGWDVIHHVYGSPIVPFLPSSSAGCAICDVVIAAWCFAGGPALLPAPSRHRPAA
jgi:Family of unknown function (DUF6010)